MRDLKISAEPIPGVDSAAVIRLSGRFSPPSLTSFVARLKAARDAGLTQLILDLGGVDYINSTALGTLVIEADHFREAGGNLAICNLPHQVALMVELLGLSTLLNASPTFTEAAEGLGLQPSAPLGTP